MFSKSHIMPHIKGSSQHWIEDGRWDGSRRHEWVSHSRRPGLDIQKYTNRRDNQHPQFLTLRNRRTVNCHMNPLPAAELQKWTFRCFRTASILARHLFFMWLFIISLSVLARVMGFYFYVGHFCSIFVWLIVFSICAIFEKYSNSNDSLSWRRCVKLFGF